MEKLTEDSLKSLLSKGLLSTKIDPEYKMMKGEIELLKEFGYWEDYKRHQEGVISGNRLRYVVSEFAQSAMKHYAIDVVLYKYVKTKKMLIDGESWESLKNENDLISLYDASSDDEDQYRFNCKFWRGSGYVLRDSIIDELAIEPKFVKKIMEEISHIPQDKLDRKFDFSDSARVSFLKDNFEEGRAKVNFLKKAKYANFFEEHGQSLQFENLACSRNFKWQLNKDFKWQFKDFECADEGATKLKFGFGFSDDGEVQFRNCECGYNLTRDDWDPEMSERKIYLATLLDAMQYFHDEFNKSFCVKKVHRERGVMQEEDGENDIDIGFLDPMDYPEFNFDNV